MSTIIEKLIEVNPKALTADGLDRAMIGIGDRNGNKVAVYSSEKCIEVFMEDNEWCYDDAIDYFCYNTEGAYMGKYTPIFKWEEDGDCKDWNGDEIVFEV